MLSFFGRILKSKKATEEEIDPMKKFLIAGLGNIGPKYENTRHNIGFKVLDELAAKHEAVFTTQKLGDIAQFRYKGRTFILLKPSTYMNLSGKAVNYWLQKEKVAIENLLVVTDDLNLPFGTLRLKTKGSDGGHNGLKSLISHLQSNDFWRLRIGIGRPCQQDVSSFVLGCPSPDDLTMIRQSISLAKQYFGHLLSGDEQAFMRNVHNRGAV